MLDRDISNDTKILSIICSLCDWTSLLKDYEVKLSYFDEFFFDRRKSFLPYFNQMSYNKNLDLLLL
jgi:hypothetical protein